MLRLVTIAVSVALHAALVYSMLERTNNDAALDMGSGDDVFSVEQGIAIEGLAKLGDALEKIETAELTPLQPTAPPKEVTPPDVRPVEELQDAITSNEGREDNIVKLDDPPPPEERKTEEVAEVKPTEPPPPEEQKPLEVKPQELPPPDIKTTEAEEVQLKEQPLQVATVQDVSSGQAQSGGNATQKRAYLGQLRSSLERAKVNPRSRAQGTVMLRFSVAADGKLLSHEIVASSGSSVLDNAAVAALRRAAPFPPMPEVIGGDGPMVVSVPFKFIAR